MPEFDAYLKGFAALVCVGFGLVVLSTGHRRGGQRWLAVFLFLVAGNQVFETLRALAPSGSEAARLSWQAAHVFAALDPFVLHLFARAHAPQPARRWPPFVFGAMGLTTLVLTPALGGDPRGELVAWLTQSAYTAIVYLAVATRFLRQYARDPGDASARVFYLAVALVAVRPWQELPFLVAPLTLDLLGIPDSDQIPGRVGAIWWSVLLGAMGILIAMAARLPNRATTMPVAILGMGLGYALTAILGAASFVSIPHGGRPLDPAPAYMDSLAVLGRATAAVRWILFGGFVSAAVLRDDLLGMSLARRRVAARALVALGMAGLVGLLYAAMAIALGPASVQVRPMDVLLLALILAATQGFGPLIDRVAQRAYAVPMPADRAAALEAYRRALQQAVDEGRDARRDPGLARLATELGLAEAEAGLLASLADESQAGPLLAGQRVGGRYHVRRLVGRGGAGRVFLARDETLDRDVVLKEVVHDEPDDEAALREARAAAALQHPNIVIVHDVIRRGGASLLVTEYVPGGTLAERIALAGPLSAKEGARVLAGVLAGLEAVHEHGLVHRDLKPDNVLFALDGTPKIADFGIARARRGITARFDEPDAFIGTPEFMAPEQRAGARATPATDVYAVGRLARRCLRQPLPTEIERVVAKALAEEPAARYPSAREMRADLARALLRVTL